MINITVPVPPSANRWHRRVGRATVLSKEAKLYTAALRVTVLADLSRAATRVVCPVFPSEPLRVEIHWFRARKAGDVDKRGAIMLDALQGLIYGDDGQIADYRIVRHDSQPGQARMVVTVTPIGAA